MATITAVQRDALSQHHAHTKCALVAALGSCLGCDADCPDWRFALFYSVSLGECRYRVTVASFSSVANSVTLPSVCCVQSMTNTYSPVVTARVGRYGARIPAGRVIFFIFRSVKTCSGAHTAQYLVITGPLSSGGSDRGVRLTNSMYDGG